MKIVITAKDFATLSDDEKSFCSALLLCTRPLHFELACDLYHHLGKNKITAEKLSTKEAEKRIQTLVNRGIFSNEYDVLQLREALVLNAFVYPFWKGHHTDILKAIDSFIAKARSNRYFYYTNLSSATYIGAKAHDLYTGNVTFEPRDFGRFNYSNVGEVHEGVLGAIYSPEWFSRLPESSQIKSFIDFYNCFLFSFQDNVKLNLGIFNCFLAEKWLDSASFKLHAAHYVAEYLILRGDFPAAERYIAASTSPERYGLTALMAYIQHGAEDAVPLFRSAYKSYKKETGRRNVAFQTLADVFFLVALLQRGGSDCIDEANNALSRLERTIVRFHHFYISLHKLNDMKQHARANDTVLLQQIEKSSAMINRWFGCFVMHWIGTSMKSEVARLMRECVDAARFHGLDWLAVEGLTLLEVSDVALDNESRTYLDAGRSRAKFALAARSQAKEDWERLLDAVELAISPVTADKAEPESRLIWVFQTYGKESRALPYEQKKLKSGKWSKGKEVLRYGYMAPRKPYPAFYSDIDRQIIDFLSSANQYGMNRSDVFGQAIQQLTGQENVYRDDFETQVKVVAGEPELVLSGTASNLIVTWHPESTMSRFTIVNQPKDKIVVYDLTPYHQRLAGLLVSGTRFPLSASSRLHDLLSSLSSKIKVRTELTGKKAVSGFATLVVDYSMHVRLLPEKDGLLASLRIAPVPAARADFIPGLGLREAIVDVDGKKFLVKRDMKKELALAAEIVERCPSLEGLDPSDFSAAYPELADSLQLLLELQQVPGLSIDWPENYKPKKVGVAQFTDMKFRISGEQNWFSLDGELKVDEEKVLNLQLLLRQYDGHSRFITIDEGRILAITDDFRRKLNDIASYTALKNGKRNFARAALPAFEGLLADAEAVEVDETWKSALEQFKNISSMSFPVPASFTAELREYQLEGYTWLSRLAAMSMGACLADDMGLGKTIEALALILSRAGQGPTLVIAPTSVCINWVNEARRFAPALRPILFSVCDRPKVLESLAPFDLVICSYGIMSNEIASLSKIEWQTLILDEAQLIKNMNTGRSQAAMSLNGNFKMLLTGTPVENHLGELWNLFNFLNPGLLGNIESFNQNFAGPIQIQGDKQAQGRLKRLVQPFILRRTKSQVLLDLPEKTEITLHVDLSAEEAALYESIRRDSLEKIAGCESTARPMRILAEIMRLRRMCCNPALVLPDTNIRSSKMELLEKIVEELLDNQHKALIFSQFVDHLALVRKLLDKMKVSYQYLDGSTPQKARAEAVASFQRGDDRFFLISLKAGGLGLNLTAADYVIHLDPWWNPAVEDQASDRAYRIGQTRPVTIYRLITANTIEDKIVALHGRKRELADGLLSGSDLAAKVSAEELLQLIVSA